MKKIFMFIALTFILKSCTEPDFDSTSNNEIISQNRVVDEHDNYELKKKFATALHEAMLNNKELREFLKEEALIKFNKDYDILYNYVKSKQIGNYSFRDILLDYFEREEDLAQIESQIPSLTIFVPSLPNDSFSAELWNTDEEVPLVAIRLLNNDKTPIISSRSENHLLDHNIIPGFPVVVIKENERILTEAHPDYETLDTDEYRYDGFSFRHIHINFDGLRPQVNITINGPIHLVEAWEEYGKHENLGWHRDYIYYNLQPNSTNGQYINDYKEYVRDFRIEGDTPWIALSNISQPSVIDGQYLDPELNFVNGSQFYNYAGAEVNQGSFWTDGNFDFEIKLYYDEEATPHKVPFTAAPESLFEIQYEQIGNLFSFLDVYVVNGISQKTMTLHQELMDWQIHNVANNFIIDIEEIDSNVKIKENKSNSYTYNTNFNFSTKIGLELGGSAEIGGQQSIEVQYNEHGDFLGTALIRFGDNIIIDEHHTSNNGSSFSAYKFRRYDLGNCSLSLVPVKVQ